MTEPAPPTPLSWLHTDITTEPVAFRAPEELNDLLSAVGAIATWAAPDTADDDGIERDKTRNCEDSSMGIRAMRYWTNGITTRLTLRLSGLTAYRHEAELALPSTSRQALHIETSNADDPITFAIKTESWPLANESRDASRMTQLELANLAKTTGLPAGSVLAHSLTASYYIPRFVFGVRIIEEGAEQSTALIWDPVSNGVNKLTDSESLPIPCTRLDSATCARFSDLLKSAVTVLEQPDQKRWIDTEHEATTPLI